MQDGLHSEKLSQKIFLTSFNQFCGAGILLGRQALHHLVSLQLKTIQLRFRNLVHRLLHTRNIDSTAIVPAKLFDATPKIGSTVFSPPLSSYFQRITMLSQLATK